MLSRAQVPALAFDHMKPALQRSLMRIWRNQPHNATICATVHHERSKKLHFNQIRVVLFDPNLLVVVGFRKGMMGDLPNRFYCLCLHVIISVSTVSAFQMQIRGRPIVYIHN